MAAVLPQYKTPETAGRMPDGAFAAGEGWSAHLRLSYAASGKKSCLLRQDRRGPLFVQKPFYPEGPETCHTYILHPPGGVVGGDGLSLETTLEPGSQALITSPSAGKFYRSAGPTSVQINRLEVARGAVLEWLPQETIIYPGARVRMRTRVRLAQDAGFMGWEVLCLGLPACGQTFSAGRIDQRFEVWREERPLLIEPLILDGADPMLRAAWGLDGRPVIATLAATVDLPEVADAVRRHVAVEPASGLFTATRVEGLTVCRFLGDDVYAGLKCFRQAWEILRPAFKGSAACAPRIWAT